MNKFFVAQIGYEIFGVGETEREAYDDAMRELKPDSDNALPTFEDMSRDVGSARTASGRGRKHMTQHGEMHTGEMVMLTREQAIAHGFNVAQFD